MKNTRNLIILGIVLIVAIFAAYIFWPLPKAPIPAKRARAKKARNSQNVSVNTTQTLAVLTTAETLAMGTTYSSSSDSMGVNDESPYDFHQYTGDSGGPTVAEVTGYRDIGEKDLFALLIPPPPPPPPRMETVAVKTRNWVLWEIMNPNECVIADARPMEHNLQLNQQLEGVEVMKIAPAEDKVEVAMAKNTSDSRWLQLKPIATITKGWKLTGSIPSLKQAFIVTGDNKRHKVKEGETLQHVLVKKIVLNKVLLQYGTMTIELTQ